MADEDELREKFRAIAARWAADAVPRFRDLGAAIEILVRMDAPFDEAVAATALRLAHSLAGGGGTVGFRAVSEAVLPIEETLVRIAGIRAVNDADRRALLDFAGRIPGLIAGLDPSKATLPKIPARR